LQLLILCLWRKTLFRLSRSLIQIESFSAKQRFYSIDNNILKETLCADAHFLFCRMNINIYKGTLNLKEEYGNRETSLLQKLLIGTPQGHAQRGRQDRSAVYKKLLAGPVNPCIVRRTDVAGEPEIGLCNCYRIKPF